MKEQNQPSYEGLPAEWIATICWAATEKRVSRGAMATWAALMEILAQRRAIERSKREGTTRRKHPKPKWSARNVARIRGVQEAKAQAEIDELDRKGLIAWSEDELHVLAAYPALDPLPRRHKKGRSDETSRNLRAITAELKSVRKDLAVPVLRGALRFLARGRRLSDFAATLAIMTRTCWRKGSTLTCSGTILASWVEDTFGIAASTWRDALHRLEEDGVIRRERLRSTKRRCTQGVIVHVLNGWRTRTREFGGNRHQSTLESGGKQNQELSPPERDLKEPGTLRGHAGFSKIGSPDLQNVVREDLIDPKRSLALRDQAVERGLCAKSESGTLNFLASIEHALAHGRNPVRLFVSNLLRRRLFVTREDEERAQNRLRRAHGISRNRPAAEPVDARTNRSQSISEVMGGLLAVLS